MSTSITSSTLAPSGMMSTCLPWMNDGYELVNPKRKVLM